MLENSTIELLFMAKVKKDPETECWLWQGALYPNGYGLVPLPVIPRRTALAHRIAYQHFVGVIPEGMELDHKCRVRHCVNPEHLEPVTRSENLLRSPLMGASQTIKTHCPKGHPYNGDNLYIYKGRRHCRACRRATKEALRADPAYKIHERILDTQRHRDARTEARGGIPAVPNGEKTHCPQGHPYVGENLYVSPQGARQCRMCIRIRTGRA